MNVTSEQARKWMVGLWMLTAVFAVIREAQNPHNPGRPLPRPCVLLGSAAAYTVLGLGAELLPQVFTLAAIGVTVGAFLAPAVTRGGTTPLGVLTGVVQRLDAISGGASGGG